MRYFLARFWDWFVGLGQSRVPLEEFIGEIDKADLDPNEPVVYGPNGEVIPMRNVILTLRMDGGDVLNLKADMLLNGIGDPTDQLADVVKMVAMDPATNIWYVVSVEEGVWDAFRTH